MNEYKVLRQAADVSASPFQVPSADSASANTPSSTNGSVVPPLNLSGTTINNNTSAKMNFKLPLHALVRSNSLSQQGSPKTPNSKQQSVGQQQLPQSQLPLPLPQAAAPLPVASHVLPSAQRQNSIGENKTLQRMNSFIEKMKTPRPMQTPRSQVVSYF